MNPQSVDTIPWHCPQDSGQNTALQSNTGWTPTRIDQRSGTDNWWKHPLNRPPAIAVVIPAHNEEDQIVDTIRSIQTQSLKPITILVVADNCTDNTIPLAASTGVYVGITHNNNAKKAGALNQGLGCLELDRYDAIATVDADTVAHPEFLANAWKVMKTDPLMGGVSAVFRPKPKIKGRGLMGAWLVTCQTMEFARSASLRGTSEIHTMSGTGSVYRTFAVQEIIEQRGYLFAERPSNLVEDYETTLALKASGWRVTANRGVITFTDVMLTLPELWAQRIRWQRGTIDEWRRQGWRPWTRKSISLSIATMTVQVVSWLLVAAAILTVARHGGLPNKAYWIPLVATSMLTPVFNAWHSREAGVKASIMSLLAIPDLVYNMLRTCWTWAALALSLFTPTPTKW